MANINLDKIIQIVAIKLTDKNFSVLEKEDMELLGVEVMADINMTPPVSVYDNLVQIPIYYQGIFIVGIYCKCLDMQGLEEKKRHLKVSDGGLTVDPPDVASQLDKMRSSACSKYLDMLKAVKKWDSKNNTSRRLKPALITDIPYQSITRRGDREFTTWYERWWAEN